MKKLLIPLALVIFSFVFGAAPSRFDNGIETEFVRPYMNTGPLEIKATGISTTTINITGASQTTGLTNTGTLTNVGLISANNLALGGVETSKQLAPISLVVTANYQYLGWTNNGANNNYFSIANGGGASPYVALSTGANGTNGAIPMNFQVNEVTKMTLAANGNVGIGTTAPSYPLDVVGAIEGTTGASGGFIAKPTAYSPGITDDILLKYINPTGGDSGWCVKNRVGFTGDLAFDRWNSGVESVDCLHLARATGYVGINTKSPQTALEVAGTVSANEFTNGGFIDYSGSTTIGGFNTATASVKAVYYYKSGKMVTCYFTITGGSNGTSASFTLPFANKNSTGAIAVGAIPIQDNGTYAIGLYYMQPNSTTVICYKDAPANQWTTTGAKFISGIFTYITN